MDSIKARIDALFDGQNLYKSVESWCTAVGAKPSTVRNWMRNRGKLNPANREYRRWIAEWCRLAGTTESEFWGIDLPVETIRYGTSGETLFANDLMNVLKDPDAPEKVKRVAEHALLELIKPD